MPHNLYTYVPKKNTLETEGLYGPSGDSEENLARRYGWRAGSTDKMDILNWLESTAPGRSHAVSVLTEPIPEDIDGRLGEFRDSSAMVTLPSYRELLAAGAVVPPLYRSNTDGAGMLPRKRMSYRPIQWEKARKSFDGLAFKNIPHYLLVTKDGRIPPHLLLAIAIAGADMEKQAASQKEEPAEYSVSGAILGCLGNNSNQVEYEVTEDLPDDPWQAIIHSKNALTRSELQKWHDLHNVDVDNKGVPYYFIVSHNPTGKQFVWYSDDVDMMPISTEDERKKAVLVGQIKGLVPEQLDF